LPWAFGWPTQNGLHFFYLFRLKRTLRQGFAGDFPVAQYNPALGDGIFSEFHSGFFSSFRADRAARSKPTHDAQENQFATLAPNYLASA
jgi:hypothetical protein